MEWRGSLTSAAVLGLMRESRLVALPSLWFEGFPRVAAEAMSVGRPLVLWEGSGLSRIADRGAAWALPADSNAWAQRLTSLGDKELLGAAAASRLFYEEHCTPEIAVEQLLRTYSSVIRPPGIA